MSSASEPAPVPSSGSDDRGASRALDALRTLLIPGEVFNKKIVDYLKFSREFNTKCPGFETDIHGLVELEDEDGNVRYYADCVAAGRGEQDPQPLAREDNLVQVGADGPFGRTV